MNTIGDRIKHLRQLNNMTQAELAGKVDISRSNISRMEKNEINPSANNIVQICTFFKVYADWLLTGDGEMQKKAILDMPPPKKPINIYNGIEISVEEGILINTYRSMTNEGKENVQLNVRDMYVEHKKKEDNLSNSNVEAGAELFPYNDIDVS